MAKSIKMHYAEKDDPMFTGRFHVHSVRDRDKESGQKKKKTDKVKIRKEYKSKKEWKIWKQ